MDDRPFSNSEVVSLLAEIIRAANPHPNLLLNVIHQHGMHSPSWMNIVPPPGRTLNQCMKAFDDLRSPNPIRGAFDPQTPSPISASVPSNLKRPFAYTEGTYAPGRMIQPKPAPGGRGYDPVSSTEQAVKKRRGRPTKAMTLARAEAQAASAGASGPSRGEVLGAPFMPAPTVLPPPEIQPSIPQHQQQQQPPPPPPAPPNRPNLHPISRVTISSIVTPSAPAASASQSSSSSGKRRRRRSIRSDPEDLPSLQAERERETSQAEEYRSPYARMGPTSPSMTARAPDSRYGGGGGEREGEAPRRQRDTPESGTRPLSPTTHPSSEAPK